MKIAIIQDSLIRCGAERQALYSIAGLRRLGCDAEFIYYNQVANAYDPVAEFGVTPVFMPKLGKKIRFIRQLANYIRQRKFDLVHGFMDMPTVYAAVAAGMAGCRTVFGGIRVEYDGTGLVKLAHRCVDYRLAGWIVNSAASARRLSEVLRIEPGRIHVVYNGIDTRRFVPRISRQEARSKLSVKPGVSVISIVARLEEQKNHRMFLEVASLMSKARSDVSFLIVGDGSLRTDLEKESRNRGLDGVLTFLGNRPNVEEVLWASDVSVLTSNYEGLSNVLLESMASGLPVVATDFAGVEELVEDGKTGVVVPRGNAGEMAESIASLLDNQDLRKRLGESGRIAVCDRFGLDAMSRRLLEVYEGALREKFGEDFASKGAMGGRN